MALTGTSAVTPARAAQMRDATKRPTAALGTSGKPLLGGRVYGFEHNTRLQGPAKAMEAYRKAERSPGVATGWGCARGLALSARWDVTAADDSPLAEACAEHVRLNLGIGRTRSALGRSWERTLSEFLTPQLRGFGIWELVCRNVGGTDYTVPLWRDPASVSGWFVDEWEQLVGVEQSAGWLTSRAEIPVSRLLYLARDAEGTNFEGVGLLRPIEPLTRDQTTTMQAMMAAVQRWALGTPDVVLDRRAWREANPGKNSDADWTVEKAAWESALAKYMNYERNYIVREAWSTLGTYGGKVESAGFEGVLNLQHRLILTAFLAQFLMLGSSGSGGSYSLGETHADVAQQAAQNMLEGVRDDLNTSLIPRMVRWGLPVDVPDEALPTLTFKGIRAPLWVSMMDKLPALFTAVGVTPQTDLESEVLEELGFAAEAVDRTPGERLRGLAPGRIAGQVPPGPNVIRGTAA